MTFRTLCGVTAAFAISASGLVGAADFSVPSLSRCLDDMGSSNTSDPKVFNLNVDDIYYDAEDVRDFAVQAVVNMTENFASEGSECRTFSQPMNRETVTCEEIGGVDACIIPSDAGEFIVVRDYVDSANIVLTEYDSDYRYFPKIDAKNDQESLWLPNPSSCYSELLEGLVESEYFSDSQAYSVDVSNYTYFDDFRYVLARSTRDVVGNVAAQNEACHVVTEAHPATEAECLYREGKPSLCGITSTDSGFFVYISDAETQMHVLFNRWD
ncbi:hypothetical protein [Marinibactrum halimedae]|uniref:Uncharacterized protein n=1 Tax=Marinibactrum halimedae TaxID=1444977 RepID=A0AA37WMR4_9GAMM|nr:hypothetical protein [Marinibactrum halimedae]MCD9460265.1 hypothetical protein [Marinibactrum halimedae]GLS24352.1 hypothetical protein GCM10007877_00630 [Marinibactrum halimedae]